MIWRARIALMILLAFAGCGPKYYLESNINSVQVGMPKGHLMQAWRPTEGAPGLTVRAARRTESGALLEVAEIPLVSDQYERGGERKIVRTYWFLFENGKLVQWGRPEDWREASRQYQIQYTPTLGVPR